MPADTLNVSLTGPLVDEVRAAAKARDISVEDFVRLTLTANLLLNDVASPWDDDTAEDEAAFAEYERTGVAFPGKTCAPG
jgi:hypothetical protein